jgi:hypothetical protein
MNMFKTLAIATLLTASTAGVALADNSSAIGALGSGTSVRFDTVFASQLLSVNGASTMQQVDLDSLKARISQDPRLLEKLERYGASLDDVVGIDSDSQSNVRIFVLG